MITLILKIYSFFTHHRKILFGVMILLFAIFAWRASKINFQEDIFSFLPQDPNQKSISFVSRELASSNPWILMLEAAPGKETDFDILCDLADSLASFIEKKDSLGCFTEIFYKIDESRYRDVMAFAATHFPLYLEDEDYAKMDSLLTMDAMEDCLRANKELLMSPASAVMGPWLRQDPFHFSAPVLSRLRNVQPGSGYPIINSCLFTRDSLSVLIFLTSSLSTGDTGNNDHLVDLMEDAVIYTDKVSESNALLQYFSGAAIGVENARCIKNDTILLLCVSLLCIALVLYLFFHSLVPVLFIALPVVFGGLFALAVMQALEGTMSAIAIGAMSAILGIALNYSLHYFIHSRNCLSAKENLKELGFPMLTGCITTVGAFFSLFFIQADSLRDFGLLAALCLVGAVFFTLVFLPHFPIHYGIVSSRSGFFNRGIEAIAGFRPEHHPLWTVSAIALTVFLAFFVSQSGFDVDMHHINYMGPRQEASMQALRSKTYELDRMRHLVSLGNTFEDALEAQEEALPLLEELRNSQSVRAVSGPGNFYPSQKRRDQQLQKWQKYWEQRPEFKAECLAAGSNQSYKPAYFDAFFSLLEPGTIQALKTDSLPLVREMMRSYFLESPESSAILNMVYEKPDGGKAIEELDKALDNSFIYDQNRLMQALIEMLNTEFNYVLFICSVLVFGFLLLSFRSWTVTALSFLPMAFGWIWILGIMGLFGIKFNIVNVILATFIFGLGDDYSIFIMEGMLYEHKYRKTMLSTYKTALVMSALILLIALGSLLFARHPAMHSLGLVSLIGMLSVMIVSYTISPAFFRFILFKKDKPRRIPLCISNLMRTLLVGAFLFGSSIYMNIEVLILKLFYRHRLHKAKDILHIHIQRMMAWFVAKFPGTHCRVSIQDKVAFTRPAVWIANHQSHLDLMYLLSLSPKLIVLTNHWVWNAPLYSFVIRFLDYYPVADQGFENGLPHLKTIVEQGYSILVFPEGSRSLKEGSLGRFHKGAFALAADLNIPLIPITLSGVGMILPKHEMRVFRSSVTVGIGSPYYMNPGEDQRLTAKRFRKMMQEQYNAQRAEEGWMFYRDLLKGQYLYKDAHWGQSRRFIQSAKGKALLDSLPLQGRLLIQNSGYGAFALLAAWMRPNLEIIAQEDNPQKRGIAESCILKPGNLVFVESTPKEKDFDLFININSYVS